MLPALPSHTPLSASPAPPQSRLGLNWMSKFFLLMTYSLLLMPGFLQVMWYYFFSPNVRRSIPYGRLPRNSLDIFVPASPSPHPRPVVIFITGGAWIIGYKAWGTLLAQALEERGVIVAKTAAGKTEIRYPSVSSLAPFAPAAAAASAKVHPVDAWRINAAAASASAAVTISDVPVTSFPDSGNSVPAALPVLATCTASGLPASPSPLPAAAVFPPVASAGFPADAQAAPAAGLRAEIEAAAEALRAGTPLFRSLSMRRLLAHLAGSGGAEGNEPGRGILDVWSSEQIKSFIGVSGCYNLINLAPQFESRGMNPYLFLSIFEGEESLPLFSPELLISRPTFKAAAPLLPPVHLYHGVDDISVPFTASVSQPYLLPPCAPVVDSIYVCFTARYAIFTPVRGAQ
ncbi:unnamed protein product [Closterium sp. Yama58-4]|nr:unnamed protein product [Closterium sp. Yama58-4]